MSLNEDHSPYEPRCGKVRHPSRKVAVRELRNAVRNHDRRGKDRGVLVVYCCGKCGGWHAGNADPGVLRLERELKRRTG